MKLVGDLKDKVEKAENQEDAKKMIEEAGMELTDEEMNQVAGGSNLWLALHISHYLNESSND